MSLIRIGWSMNLAPTPSAISYFEKYPLAMMETFLTELLLDESTANSLTILEIY